MLRAAPMRQFVKCSRVITRLIFKRAFIWHLDTVITRGEKRGVAPMRYKGAGLNNALIRGLNSVKWFIGRL